MVYAAHSEAEVRKIIENDIYATSGVWDLEKSQIIPVRGLLYRKGTSTNGCDHSMWRLSARLFQSKLWLKMGESRCGVYMFSWLVID